MQFKTLALAGFASLAAAQSSSNQTLVQALNSSSELSTLLSLVSANPDLATTLAGLSNITILAPTNDAFEEFLGNSNITSNMSTAVSNLLQYHVLSGTYMNFSSNASFIPTALQSAPYGNLTGGQVVEVRNNTVFSGLRNSSTIMSNSTVNFNGGVAHVINRVLTLPQTISDTALSYGLTAFAGAINNVSLVDTVNSAQDVTVFVPNNEAFQAIGSGVSNLSMAELTSILTYHVVNGTFYSNMLSNTTVPTLQGTDINVTVRNSSTIFVNGARVTIPNVLVANGVVHVIDEVLNPNNTAASNSTAGNGTPAFSGLSTITATPFATDAPTTVSVTTVDTSSIASQATADVTSSDGAWMPGPTGALGAALGGLALLMQL